MRATIYQTSLTAADRDWALARVRFLWFARLALAVVATLAIAGCSRAKAPGSSGRKDGGQAAVQQPATPPVVGDVLHFGELAQFAPEKLLDFEGAQPETASTSKYGELSVSEFARSYKAGGKQLRVRLMDTNANQGQRAPPPPEAYEDARHLARPLRVAGAVGFVDYDKQAHLAKADLVVADRVLVSLTCENAAGPEDVERVAAAMDLGRLAQMVRRNDAARAK